MFSTTDAFVEELKTRGIAFRAGKLEQHPVDDPEKTIVKEVVDVRIRGDHELEIQSRFLFDDNEKTATASALDLASVPEDRLPAAFKLVNDFNIACRVAKYMIVPLQDQEGKISYVMSCRIDIDFDNNVVPVCIRALDYLAKIVNRNYPYIRRDVFGEEIAQ